MSSEDLGLEGFAAEVKSVFNRSDLSGQAHIDLLNLVGKIYYTGRRQGAKECGWLIMKMIQKEIF